MKKIFEENWLFVSQNLEKIFLLLDELTKDHSRKCYLKKKRVMSLI